MHYLSREAKKKHENKLLLINNYFDEIDFN